MIVTDFSIAWPLFGGILIGLSATLLLYLNGRIAGISGILFAVVDSFKELNFSLSEQLWRILFLLGLVAGAILFHVMSGTPIPHATDASYPLIIAGGLLVGFGTKLGSGCTSGHGICGMARFSFRSLVSTCIFMFAGVVSVFVVKHILGWT